MRDDSAFRKSMLYVAGIYPESPAHLLDADGQSALCGSRISVYARRFTAPEKRLCAKCSKKALFRTDYVFEMR